MTEALNSACGPAAPCRSSACTISTPFRFPPLMSLVRSVTLRMTTAPVQRTWPKPIPLIQSGRSGHRWGSFSDSMPLDDAAAVYAAVAARTADCIKVILTP